jgi:hypothetical protein
MMRRGAHVFCEELKVRIPFVTDDFSTRETTHRNDLEKNNVTKIASGHFAGVDETYHFAS